MDHLWLVTLTIQTSPSGHTPTAVLSFLPLFTCEWQEACALAERAFVERYRPQPKERVVQVSARVVPDIGLDFFGDIITMEDKQRYSLLATTRFSHEEEGYHGA